ncbi:LADA_0H06700g1_1 [Lachancea dasiensis]|uniref:Altered inheritance of mitochondria protein 24, mitochondrial n=1 Tax=Lachancea dasiensis TaxID=1072105 RepID=A0A1G4K1T2_9SACH|nr:LADA_0H06700g1_1 [Lachancea dasiensis]
MLHRFKPIASIRCLSLVKPNTSSVVPAQLAQTLDVEPVFGSANQTLDTKFQTLGTPATLCSASLPASVPLYVRRGCLVSLHNAQNLHVEHNWLGLVWSTLKHGSWRPALFHKLISPQPFNVLVAPNVCNSRLASWFGFSSQPFRTLCLLTLNGSQDWYVYGKNSLIAYEGNTSLEIRHSRLWSGRSSALPGGYRVLQGRGNALLSGAGSVYTVELSNESDELVLKSEHLLAISSKSLNDAKNAVSIYRLTSPKSPQGAHSPASSLHSATPQSPSMPKASQEFSFKEFRDITSSAIVSTWNWLKNTYSILVNGPTQYLKIRGPRSILIQSSHNVFMPATPTAQRVFHANSDSLPTSLPESSHANSSKNYLSYVTVQPNGEVRFESTSNFDAKVAEIEALKRS